MHDLHHEWRVDPRRLAAEDRHICSAPRRQSWHVGDAEHVLLPYEDLRQEALHARVCASKGHMRQARAHVLPGHLLRGDGVSPVPRAPRAEATVLHEEPDRRLVHVDGEQALAFRHGLLVEVPPRPGVERLARELCDSEVPKQGPFSEPTR